MAYRGCLYCDEVFRMDSEGRESYRLHLRTAHGTVEVAPH